MPWTDLSGVFTFGSQLSSTQQQNLRDNAVYNKDLNNGEPAIHNIAVNSHSYGSYTTVYASKIYVPPQVETLNCQIRAKDFGGGTSGWRITITDSGGSSTSDTQTTASASFATLTFSVNINSIDNANWALCEIKANGSNNGFGGLSGYWDLYRY